MGLGLRNGEADLGSGGFCLRLSVAAEQGQRAPSPSPGGCESPKDTGDVDTGHGSVRGFFLH